MVAIHAPMERECVLIKLEMLRDLLRRVEGIPVSAYEELDGEALSPLAQDTRDCLESAIEAAGAILDHYDEVVSQRQSLRSERVEDPRSSELCGEVERAMDEDVGMRRIQNLAFIARMGLRTRLSAMEAMEAMEASPGKWEMIAAASSSLREIMKALGALAVAVCTEEELPEPESFYVTELERSLAIRRAYRIFGADVDALRPPAPGEVGKRLRRAASAIAKLVGRPIYPSMRVHDRFLLRALQRRLQAWLSGGKTGDPEERRAPGLQLFQELANIVTLMRAVNERAELRQHDARVIAEVALALESGQLDGAAAIVSLRPVHGRDLELDALLDGAALPAVPWLVARLHDLTLQLRPQPRSEPAARPSPADLPERDDFI